MLNLFDIPIGDIKALNDLQFTELMQCLISSELAANGLPRTNAYVSFDIDVPDGGADGIVAITSSSVLATDHIPAPHTVFQAKSGRLKREQFERELFEARSKKSLLKPRVKEVLEAGGAYVLFYGQTCNDKARRIKAMTAAVNAVRPDLISPRINIYDCSDIVAWCKRHLAALVHVARSTGKTSLLSGFVTWKEWSGYGRFFRNPFVPSDHISDHLSRIQTTFGEQRKPNKALRLIGQSGLGKTRIVLEAFRPPEDPSSNPAQFVLSQCVAYADSPRDDVLRALRQLRRLGMSGIVVVDNCNRRMHEELKRELEHVDSSLHLLTIDHNVTDEPLIRNEFLVKKASVQTLREIVQALHPSLPPHHLDTIARFCDGYPEIAARLSDAPLETALEFDVNLIEDSLIENLLWGSSVADEKKHEVISALSLFTNVHYSESYTSERDYIATSICEMSAKEFHSATAFFMPRVIDSIGDFIRVSPLPFAIRLAERWYRKMDRVSVNALFSNEAIPPRLAEARAERFSQLGEIERSKEIARRLMDPNAPFGRAEVLNTEQGSRIFRSLAEVNPDSAVDTLLREFGDWEIEALCTSCGPGRRHIIWALEKIVFNKRLFLFGMRVLALFAIAENEKASNNATGEYLARFQLLLAGTEADYIERLTAVDELLESGDERFVHLGLRALGRVVVESTGRTAGSEQQGTRVLEDYQPKTYGEIHAYLRGAMDRLARYGKTDDALGEVARKRIARGIRFVVRYIPVAIEDAIRTVTGSYKHAWSDALEAVEETLRYDAKWLPEETIISVRSWAVMLQPTTLEERIRLLISVPPFAMDEREDGTYVNVAEQRAADFADELVQSDPDWDLVLRKTSSGEQRQAFIFGQRLAEVVEATDLVSFGQRALRALEAAEAPNASLFVGFLVGLSHRDRGVAKAIVAMAFGMPRTATFGAQFTAAIEPDEDDVLALVPLLESRILEPASFFAFSFKPSVKRLSPAFIAAFFRRFLPLGITGAQAALHIVSSYLYGDDGTKWQDCRNLMRDVVLTHGIFTTEQRQQLEHYYLEQAAKKILDDAQRDTGFAEGVALEIVRVCKQRSFPFSAYDIMRPLAFHLLASYPDVSWPIFRKALRNRGDLTSFHLMHVFEQRVMGSGKKNALLLLSDETIDEWLANEPSVAAPTLARHIPLFTTDDQSIIISPVVQRLLARYGNVSGVTSEMGANLESFGNVGSLVPAYTARLSFLRQLSGHAVPEVSSWAREYLPFLERRTRNQEKRDEEWQHGILARSPWDET